MGFLGADFGFDSHSVRGGNQMSEVSLADIETSVFRVCCRLNSGQGSKENRASAAETKMQKLIHNEIFNKNWGS